MEDRLIHSEEQLAVLQVRSGLDQKQLESYEHGAAINSMTSSRAWRLAAAACRPS